MVNVNATRWHQLTGGKAIQWILVDEETGRRAEGNHSRSHSVAFLSVVFDLNCREFDLFDPVLDL